jgi:hypothetical protein
VYIELAARDNPAAAATWCIRFWQSARLSKMRGGDDRGPAPARKEAAVNDPAFAKLVNAPAFQKLLDEAAG